MAVEARGEQKKLDTQLASLVASSSTIKALSILTERAASPKEIAPLLELSTSATSHHVKKLEALGMVELVEEREVGSAIQHFYRAVVRPVISNEEWEKLSIEKRERFSIWIFQLILADAARSFDASLFDACPRNHLSRTALVLDDEGFDEVAEIQDRALSEIFEAQARSAERLAGGAERSANVIAAMTSFEVPQGVNSMKVQEVPPALPTVWVRKSN